MPEQYLRHFQDEEDEIEGSAYLVWRRFHRLGLPNDVLSIKLSEGFLPCADDEDANPRTSEDDGIGVLEKKLVFRNFNNDEMALIQLGRAVSLLAGGLSKAQYEHYKLLRNYFLGCSVVTDYYQALTGHKDYDPKEIASVASEHGNFTKGLLSRFDDVDFCTTLLSPPGALVSDASYQSPKEKKPKREEKIPRPIGHKSYEQILDLTKNTIAKIDEMLLSKM